MLTKIIRKIIYLNLIILFRFQNIECGISMQKTFLHSVLPILISIVGYKWVRYTGARYFVPGMISVGKDLDGMILVVGRAYHNGDILPAKVKPEHGVAYVAHGGKEHMKHEFEVKIIYYKTVLQQNIEYYNRTLNLENKLIG